MTQLGGQDELIESPKEWQISETGGEGGYAEVVEINGVEGRRDSAA